MQEFESPVIAPVGKWTANDAAELMAFFRNLELAELVI